MAEEVVRDLVVSLPLICECAKEERCVNASVDGIVATLSALAIRIDATATNRSKLFRGMGHARRGEEITIMPLEPFEF